MMTSITATMNLDTGHGGETWNNEQNFNVVNVWTEAECLPICR